MPGAAGQSCTKRLTAGLPLVPHNSRRKLGGAKAKALGRSVVILGLTIGPFDGGTLPGGASGSGTKFAPSLCTLLAKLPGELQSTVATVIGGGGGATAGAHARAVATRMPAQRRSALRIIGFSPG
jgi:hypothetical protein